MNQRVVRRSRRKGFTLLEVLIVIVIIGLLAAVVVPNLVGVLGGGREDLTRSTVKSGLNGALDNFMASIGRYPTTDEGLAVLVTPPDDEEMAKKWRGPYLKDAKIPRDSWGNEFIYVSPGEVNTNSYDLSSPGPNGRPGDDDDITNWDRA
jgi:general secretion pathway protein G